MWWLRAAACADPGYEARRQDVRDSVGTADMEGFVPIGRSPPAGCSAVDLPGGFWAPVRRFSFTGLSEDAHDALIERAADLADVPWEVVGFSRGILSFHVDESARLIRIFNVVWIG